MIKMHCAANAVSVQMNADLTCSLVLKGFLKEKVRYINSVLCQLDDPQNTTVTLGFDSFSTQLFTV